MSIGPVNPLRGQDEREEFPGWEEEGLFARDYEGRLIRMDRATADDLDRDVTLTIDGRKVTVKKAVPATDDVGRLRKDDKGRMIPRATTIYDAATQLFGAGPSNPIPLLCHREYMDPGRRLPCLRGADCQIQGADRPGRRRAQAAAGMPAPGRGHDDRRHDRIARPEGEVARPVGREGPRRAPLDRSSRPLCQGDAVGRLRARVARARPGVGAPRFARRKTMLPKDDSSLVIAVDHNACILCDRCVRGCNAVKENHVIGRMGKGFAARIAFDLDAPMGSSSCVACGECMVSCPTGALTHRGIVAARLPDGQEIRADELFEHPIPEIRQAFQGVAHPFLRWNARGVVRRHYRQGEVICREGEFGSTAFLIEKGSVELCIETPLEHIENRPVAGFLHALGRFTSRLTSRPETARRRRAARVHSRRCSGQLGIRPAPGDDDAPATSSAR